MPSLTKVTLVALALVALNIFFLQTYTYLLSIGCLLLFAYHCYQNFRLELLPSIFLILIGFIEGEYQQEFLLIALVLLFSADSFEQIFSRLTSYSKDIRARVDLPQLNSYQESDIIHSDGIIVDGTAWVVENLISPDQYLVRKSLGFRVYAGSKILIGELSVESEKIPTAINSNFSPKIIPASNTYTYLKIALAIISLAMAFVFKPVSIGAAATLLIVESILLLNFNKQLFILKTYLLGLFNKTPKAISKLSKYNKICFELDAGNLYRTWCLDKIEILDDAIGSDFVYSNILSMSALAVEQDIFKEISQYLYKKIGNKFDPAIQEKLIISNGILAVTNKKMIIGNEEFLINNGIVLNQSDLVVKSPSQFVLYFCVENYVVARLFFKDSIILSIENLSTNENLNLKLFTQQSSEAFTNIRLKGEIAYNLHGELLNNQIKSNYPAIVYSNEFPEAGLNIIKDFDYITKKTEANTTYLLNRNFSNFSECWNAIFKFNVINYILYFLVFINLVTISCVVYSVLTVKITIILVLVVLIGLILDFRLSKSINSIANT